ncbi:hypothetical protein ACLOJK_002994 [Asimina triloba]
MNMKRDLISRSGAEQSQRDTSSHWHPRGCSLIKRDEGGLLRRKLKRAGGSGMRSRSPIFTTVRFFVSSHRPVNFPGKGTEAEQATWLVKLAEESEMGVAVMKQKPWKWEKGAEVAGKVQSTYTGTTKLSAFSKYKQEIISAVRFMGCLTMVELPKFK